MPIHGEIDVVLHGGAPGSVAGGGAVLAGDDSSVLVAFVRHAPGPGGGAEVVTAWSYDHGQSWEHAEVVYVAEEGTKLSSPSLARLESGRILLGYLESTPATSTNRILVQHSDDGGATWSILQPITPPGMPVTSVRIGNDRFVRLAPDRVLLPVLVEGIGCVAWISDDEGRTWVRGGGAIKPADGQPCSVPTALALPGGEVAMLVRTKNPAGVIYTAHSQNGGETWEMFNDWGPVALMAPFVARCAPGGDLILLWLNHSISTSLTSAVSRDGGRFWECLRTLEEQQDWPPSRLYANPSLAISKDVAHVTYCEERMSPAGHTESSRLIYRRVPLAWFYSPAPRRAPVCDVVGFIRAFVNSKSIHDPKVRAMITAPFNPASVPK